ncbi:MAG: dTMP kinase [Corynebacterium sp.]|nr:dTMP kinase [Corynebacterium sp.]
MIIVIEGIDGAGKSTLVQALVDAAAQSDLLVKRHAYPRYSSAPMGSLFTKGLRGDVGDLLDSIYGMAALFALDRHADRDFLHQAAADKNTVYILDRYVASNAAYSMGRIAARDGHTDLQPSADMLQVSQFIADFEFGECGLPVPDLSIFLDTPVEVSRARAKAREEAAGHNPDRYEANAVLQEQTAASYRYLAQQQWMGQWIHINGEEPQAIASKIMRQLKA